jgi:hypothetical protein
VEDRVVEQDGFLGDEADVAAQAAQGEFAQVAAVDAHVPGHGIEEARQEVDQRGLAGAGAADEGDEFAGAGG